MIIPSVVKICLDLRFFLLGERFIIIESLENHKESRQFSTIICCFIECLNLVDYLAVFPHDNRKDNNTKEKTHRHERPLNITSRVVVSKTNCT